MNAGIPLSITTGLRFALKSGRGPSAAPVRSAILGAVLAVAVLVTTVTFGASLNSLVAHPSLYGWNWNYALLSGFAGQEDMPGPLVTTMFDHDHYVAAWSGVNFAVAQLRRSRGADDDRAAAFSRQAHRFCPATAYDAANQVVLGSATLAALHKRVGDTVTFFNGKTKAVTLTIVGTATLTPIAKGLEMGTGRRRRDRATIPDRAA